ncbi:glycosyltransferase [Aeromicrobium sp. Leaf350]|uniref:glycosyltransferase n=1 Tax=Aeromicrobium sp. Leaf350 TaxID=2876565 RepID=UPI001E5A5A64|nr:glycosyltransferase [Aeromicrobium sp. Leaf350]
MDDEQTTPTWRSSPPTVAAVLVSHDGATWLPKVLSSLAGLTHAPTAWHAVDVSSTDGSAELLRRSFGAERITYAPSGTGFGQAVRLGLSELPRTDWIWLLHDDVTVTPGTLAGLLDEATRSSDVGIVGPKIREWPSLRRLLEVGLTLSGTASRETGLETGEPDAGQHDWAEDVLAVNTAGMLVRRDVWDELGGLDPEMPLFADDLDLGWRANRAGHRVRTAPAAVVFHAEASRRRVRERSAGDPPHFERRRAEMFTVLANVSTRRFAWQYVRLFFGTLLRFVGQLVERYPEGAADELLALRSIYLHPGRLKRARRWRQSTARVPHEDIAHLFPPWWLPYQHTWDTLVETVRAMVRPETVETVGRRTYYDDTEDGEEIELDAGPSIWRRRPWLTATVLFTILALVAGRQLLPGLSGGALLPAPETAGGWWELVLRGADDIGLPTLATAPPYVLLLALAAIPVWFAPELLVWALLVLGPVLAGLTAHRLARLVSSHRSARITFAISYGLVVAAGGAIDQGRLGTVVGLVVAPVIVNVALQLVAVPHWQTGLRLGIWTAIGAAFAPLVLPMTLLGLAVVLGARRGHAELRALATQVALSVGVMVVLLGPWLVQRALNPWRVFWDAGLAVSADPSLPSSVLGGWSGPGSAPGWIGITAVLVGALSLLPALTRSEVRWAWIVGLVGLATAVLGYTVTYGTPSGASGIVPTLALPAGVFLGSMLGAALLASEELEFLPRRLTAGLVVLALVFPALAGLHWLVRGSHDPLHDGSVGVVPAYLVDRDGSTLVVRGDLESGATYVVVRGAGEHLGEEAMSRSSDAADEVRTAVDRLLSSPSAGDVQTLLDAGITAVYLPDADEQLASRVDSAPSMQPAGSESPTSRVWTIEGEADVTVRDSPWWRVALGLVQAVSWLLALVLTAPVRRRPEPEPFADEVEEDEAVVLP